MSFRFIAVGSSRTKALRFAFSVVHGTWDVCTLSHAFEIRPLIVTTRLYPLVAIRHVCGTVNIAILHWKGERRHR